MTSLRNFQLGLLNQNDTPPEKKDPWQIACQRCPSLSEITKDDSEKLEWYQTNTRLYLNAFIQASLPRNVDYVWSFFSGRSPEFLALEQYINTGFHYIAIDNDYYAIDSAYNDLKKISKTTTADFYQTHLQDWVLQDKEINKDATHLLYFGHPYLRADSPSTEKRKKMISDVINKFKGYRFYFYGALYYRDEYDAFLNALENTTLEKENFREKEIKDPTADGVTQAYLMDGTIEDIQPNRFTLSGCSIELSLNKTEGEDFTELSETLKYTATSNISLLSRKNLFTDKFNFERNQETVGVCISISDENSSYVPRKLGST